MIDVTALRAGSADREAVARAVDAACRETGFFCVTGYGIDPALEHQLASEARAFFALPEAEKSEIAMARGGRAWRGWFPLGGELTSGRPDQKEGLYLGEGWARTTPGSGPASHCTGPTSSPPRPRACATRCCDGWTR